MSHKMPGPPVAPFSEHGAWVDGASTSADEDGSVANPYKTIQAAINAAPVPASAEESELGWMIYVLPGSYDEDLAISGPGQIFIEGRGLVVLGTFFQPPPIWPIRNITYVPSNGAYIQTNALHMDHIRLHQGGIVMSAVAAIKPHLELKDCCISHPEDRRYRGGRGNILHWCICARTSDSGRFHQRVVGLVG